MDLQPGARVSLEGHHASVRYVGPVPGQQGEWVGLEWDDAARGKHSGSVNGQHLFTCQHSPEAGSFVRRAKLPINCYGMSLVAALRERYCDAADGQDMFVQTAGNKRLAVQLVGLADVRLRQGNLAHMTAASLPDAGVSSVGPPGELQGIAPALTALDLTGSLLSSWQEVQHLTAELPALRTLDLSHSRLEAPPAGLLQGAAAALQTLVLSHCCIAWQQFAVLREAAVLQLPGQCNGLQVLAMQYWLPQLRELHLCGNGISSLELVPAGSEQRDEQPLQNLEVLDLDENSINDWQQVLRLAQLPRLKQLWLGLNKLQELQPAPEGAFMQLHTLLLRDNRINCWASVDALASLSALRDVRLSGNPLLQGAGANHRFEVIARVPTLTGLNGSSVRPHERRDSELRYLRGLAGKLEALEEDPADAQALLAAHPRYAALSRQYGAMSGVGPAAPAQAPMPSMLELQLVCVAASAGSRMGTQAKKIPTSLTIGKLKLVCERLFRIPSSRQQLHLQATSEDPFPERIDQQEDRDLAYFNAQAGAAIYIDEYPAG